MDTFLCDEDYQTYLELMAEWCAERGVHVWAYCLMPNHVHLIAVPDAEDSLRRGVGEAHRRYTRHVNFREDWRGHLWQGRFASFPMDESYLAAATRYVELNPVRANMAPEPTLHRWSSAAAHVAGEDDVLVKVRPLLDRFGDWRRFLGRGLTEYEEALLRLHGRTGRPLGAPSFVERLERALGRALKPRGPGRKPKSARGSRPIEAKGE